MKIVERNARLAHDNSQLKWDLEKLRRDLENYKHRTNTWRQKEKLIQEHNRKKEILNTKTACNNNKNNETKKSVVVTAKVMPNDGEKEKKVEIEKVEGKDENRPEKEVRQNDKNNEMIKIYDKNSAAVVDDNNNNNKDVNVKQSKSLIMRRRKESSSVIGGNCSKTVLEIRDFALDMATGAAAYCCQDFIECTQFASSVQGCCEAIRVCSAPRLLSLDNNAGAEQDRDNKKNTIYNDWWKQM